jgi:hypothetical protein
LYSVSDPRRLHVEYIGSGEAQVRRFADEYYVFDRQRPHDALFGTGMDARLKRAEIV